MWYTFPQDKDAQEEVLGFFGEFLEGYIDDHNEVVKTQQNLEELMAVFNGERPFDAESAYDKLYSVYSEIVGDEESKEELWGTSQKSLEDFKKDFTEAWKPMSYIVLTGDILGVNNLSEEKRDAFLDVFDALQSGNKMVGPDMWNIAKKLSVVVTSDDKYLESKISELEKALGNEDNAHDIFIGVKGNPSAYIQNRYQLLRQFANGEAKSIRAYMPFYDTIDKIKAGKPAPEDGVKKVDEIMRDEGLQDMRKRLKEALDQPDHDPVYSKIGDVHRNIIKNVEKAQKTANNYISDAAERGPRYKPAFSYYVDKSYANARKNLSYQLGQLPTEYNAAMEKNRTLLQDIQNKLQNDPDFSDYAASQGDHFNDKLAQFKEALQNLQKQTLVPSLDKDAVKDYTQAWDNYTTLLDNNRKRLQQEYDDQWKRDDQFSKQEAALDKRARALEKQKNGIDIMTKEQLDQLLQAKKQLDQDRKELREKTLALFKKQDKTIAETLPEILKTVRNADEQLETMHEEKKTVAFTEEQIEAIKNNYQNGMDSLKALNDEYAPYFQNVAKNYDRAVASLMEARENFPKLQEVFHAAGDISDKGIFGKKKAPEIFTNTMNAVGEYLEDRTNNAKAQKAYDACRAYVDEYMKADMSGLKSGSTAGNTRRQAVVKMLELMDTLPEFESMTMQPENEWVVVNKDDINNGKIAKSAKKYTKLDFNKLEASLAKHSTKQKNQEKSAFSDIDNLVNKRKGNVMK